MLLQRMLPVGALQALRVAIGSLSRRQRVKTSLMLTFEVVAANIRLVRKWAKRTGLTIDPLTVPFPPDHGFEELDKNGQICLAEPFCFDDPPNDLAA